MDRVSHRARSSQTVATAVVEPYSVTSPKCTAGFLNIGDRACAVYFREVSAFAVFGSVLADSREEQSVNVCPTYLSHGTDGICQPYGGDGSGSSGTILKVDNWNVNCALLPKQSPACCSRSTPSGPCSSVGSRRELRPISCVRRSVFVLPTATRVFHRPLCARVGDFHLKDVAMWVI